jgi:hypothetical protein
MSYDVLATSRAPALIVYLLDVSASMVEPLAGRQRLEVVSEALATALRRMVFLSTKGLLVAPRYRVAILAYSDQVFDVLGGVRTVDQYAALGVPPLQPRRGTDAALGFEQVEQLLQRELPNLGRCPAPLVCHMTDGEYTGADPEPVVRRIQQMATPDGNVLVENIFISDAILREPIVDPWTWPGVLPNTSLASPYAEKLRAMSSPLPEGYRNAMFEAGYQLAPGALMMLPGLSQDLVEMGFVMSTATPVAR